MFNGRYVFYSETFKLQLSSINLHNFSSSLFRSLETCPSRSCLFSFLSLFLVSFFVLFSISLSFVSYSVFVSISVPLSLHFYNFSSLFSFLFLSLCISLSPSLSISLSRCLLVSLSLFFPVYLSLFLSSTNVFIPHKCQRKFVSQNGSWIMLKWSFNSVMAM
jgi:hypothetical protein